jgi:SAM-dependent methyltransferase
VTLPRLYGELADWFRVLSEPEHYAEEAQIFVDAIEKLSRRPVSTVLELGSGGGHNASHMKKLYTLTLTDLSPDMLRVSEQLNPECEHIEGDMRTLRLGRTFDAVFVHDAVAYITTEPDLEAAMHTAFEHVRPGGVALFVPDDTVENYDGRASTGGNDLPDGRQLRYLEWPHPISGTTADITFVYVMRDANGERVEVDHHVVGVFSRATWLELLGRAGFDATALPYHHSVFRPDAGKELFCGVRPE